MASGSQPILVDIESLTGSGGVSMMENGSVSHNKTDISLSETQPLLQQRYEQKHEGFKKCRSLRLITLVICFSLSLARKRKLGMIFGVTLPCILSIFSVILFLRLGMVVGQVSNYFKKDFRDRSSNSKMFYLLISFKKDTMNTIIIVCSSVTL